MVLVYCFSSFIFTSTALYKYFYLGATIRIHANELGGLSSTSNEHF
jgi:hypothetical protein